MTRMFISLSLVASVVLSAGYATAGSDVPPLRQGRRSPDPSPPLGRDMRGPGPAPSLPPPVVTVPATPTCEASWYGEDHRGLATASGEPFNPDALTAAHPELPFGTDVVVTAESRRSVTVTITDRGPAAWTGRCIDLSRAAFEQLAPLGVGVLLVTVEVKP